MTNPAVDLNPYKPFLSSPVPGAEAAEDGEFATSEDWTQALELDRTRALARAGLEGRALKVLVLYGSLRERCVIAHASANE